MKNILFFLSVCFTGGQMAAQNVLKIEPGAVFKTTGGVVVTLADMDLQCDGTINQNPGDGVFHFSGAGNNTISGTTIPVFDIFQIAKTGGGKILLQRDINIGTGVIFTSGIIDLNNNNLHLSGAALLNGESENSRITGSNGGFVEITNTLNAPSSVNPGNLGAVVTSGASLGTTIIRRGHQSQVNAYGNGKSILRYYEIIPAYNTALNATLRLNYFNAELNGLPESSLTIWKGNSPSVWTTQGFTTRDVSLNYVEKSNIPDFSRLTLSSPGNPLPVSFILFNVNCIGDKAEISWKTAQEQNSDYFEVQKSDDGISWVSIGRVAAAGNSLSERSYLFSNNNAAGVAAFYRVAEADIDGRKQFTGIVKNECGQEAMFKVWPNPVQTTLYITLSANRHSESMIAIYDNKGSLIKQQQMTLQPGTNQYTVDMRNFVSGSYIISVTREGEKTEQAVKIIKQ